MPFTFISIKPRTKHPRAKEHRPKGRGLAKLVWGAGAGADLSVAAIVGCISYFSGEVETDGEEEDIMAEGFDKGPLYQKLRCGSEVWEGQRVK